MHNLGGILATRTLFRSTYPGRDQSKMANVTLLVISVLMVAFSFVNLVYLWRQNRKKRAIRLTMLREQEQPGLGDKSSWFEYIL